MASGILKNDTMFSANGIRPWHGLGTVVQNAPSSAEAIKLANLGWEVRQEPLYLKDGTKVDNLYANIRSDTREVLGNVRNRYTVVQNDTAFQFVDNIISNSKGIECKYETAGSLFNGRKVFMLVRLPDITLVGDKVENYLFVSNSHDGSSGLMAGITDIRIVCNNTLQLAERGARRIWKLRHTSDILSRTKEAEESLGLALNYNQRVQEDAEKMALKKINEEKFFRSLFSKLDYSEKTKEKVTEQIHQIYVDKQDLQNFRGTAWGAYNAVCDFVSNSEPARITDKTAQWKMFNFMSGYELINQAQGVLQAA